MRTQPVPLDPEQLDNLDQGCFPNNLKYIIVFDNRQEAEEMRLALEQLISE